MSRMSAAHASTAVRPTWLAAGTSFADRCSSQKTLRSAWSRFSSMCGARRNGTGLITLRSSAVCITASKSSGDSGSGAWTSAASASNQQGELLSTACSVARWNDEALSDVSPAPDATLGIRESSEQIHRHAGIRCLLDDLRILSQRNAEKRTNSRGGSVDMKLFRLRFSFSFGG